MIDIGICPSFNTQPRGGGCVWRVFKDVKKIGVSTHSRAEAAAIDDVALPDFPIVSTHSRAEAAAPFLSKKGIF